MAAYGRFVLDLLAMKDRAMRLGLYRTHQILDEASQKVGWEIADELPKEEVQKQTQQRRKCGA